MTRLSAGDKFLPSAAFINALQEMVAAWKDGRLGPTGGGPASRSVMPATTVLAYRDSEDGDLDELCPVILEWLGGTDPGPIDPTLFPLDAQRRPYVFALTPGTGNETKAVGITAEPILEGETGKVYVTGFVFCRVNITNAAHTFATLTNSATVLASAATGTCRILWPETLSTGEQWCWVLLNAGAGLTSGFTGNQRFVESVTCDEEGGLVEVAKWAVIEEGLVVSIEDTEP